MTGPDEQAPQSEEPQGGEELQIPTSEAPGEPQREEAFEQAAADSQAEGSGPDDANELRGFHFKRLMSSTPTLVIMGICVVAAGAAAGIFVKNAPVGAGAALVVLLIAILVVFAIADSRAADAFFESYAMRHQMTLMDGRSRLPAATPLLSKGDDRYAERLLEGPLGPGVDGKLANFTYEVERYSKDGKETDYYKYTLGLTAVPECAGRVPELYVQRKSGLRSLEKLEDAFRGSKERVRFESEALQRKYEIFVREGQDAVWLRRLFSPTFIVWMAESAPEKFAFELVDGSLCCYVNGHEDDAAGLDLVRAATTAVATRLREESLE